MPMIISSSLLFCDGMLDWYYSTSTHPRILSLK